MTDGQVLAVEQLQEIEAATDNVLAVEYINEPTDDDTYLRVGISIRCGSFTSKAGGLRYREREGFEISISPSFPFQKPFIITQHKRFSGFPHVQWGRGLCLYLAPDIEWQPYDGMYGFIDRLKLWLERAALNELDPEGAPMHPPVAYTNIGETSSVVIKKNAPKFEGKQWLGLAHIERIIDKRFDVVDWEPYGNLEANAEYVGAVLLLDEKMPFEFPTKISELIELLNSQGISNEQLFLLLQIAVFNNEKELPLILIIGTPMRGIVGEQLKQHLTAWYIYPKMAELLRATIRKYSKDKDLKKIGDEVQKFIIEEWVEKCGVNWCKVLEDRPEVTERRDSRSSMSIFQNLNVEIWGCGALGGNVALSLARAKPQSLKLIDSGIVTPGLLVRQPFYDLDIGLPKSLVLKDQIQRINPTLHVEAETSNILESALGENKVNSSADVIIDCTASNSVRYKLEFARKNNVEGKPDIFSMMIDSDAKRGTLAFSPSSYTGGVSDIYRKTAIKTKKYPLYQSLVDSFFSKQSEANLFQPEPGCSSPTFVASLADVASISNMLLNIIAENLKDKEPSTAKAYFVTQPHYVISEGHSVKMIEDFAFTKDLIQRDPVNGYEIRYSENAIRDLRGFINKNNREGNKDSETGGILWGEIDETLKIVWVTEVSGPPKDSIMSPNQFICGIDGVSEMNAAKKENTLNAVSYIGIWHTHPNSEAIPSEKDYNAVHNLLNENEFTTKKVFISIIGLIHTEPSIASYVFDKQNFIEVRGRYV